MPTRALNLFPVTGSPHGPRARPHPPPHLLESGLDRLPPPALGASSHPGLHPLEPTCTLVHCPPKWKQGWRELSASDTEAERQGATQPAGRGEPAKCTPRGGTQPHSTDEETEAKSQSNLLKATLQAGTGQELAFPREWG